ncbi:MAG: hypothetical protein K940chlam6_01265 [Chlamydiae bacterium]|nr:hypothetical protein [Chlamydiota bacterium]
MRNRVLIYQDQGVSRESLKHTFCAFETLLGSHYEIQKISAKFLLQEDWEKDTALCIFPGGADVPYMKALKGKGNQKIKSFVENGGAFIGICAGAYYAGDAVEFALNTPQEINEKRELKFFPGVVRGPILAPYDYKTNSGTRAAKIFTRGGESLFVFYNGGGYFSQAEQEKNVSILATYEDGLPAIIECKVGRGIAILSGVHFEYDPELLDNEDVFLKPHIPNIASSNKRRWFFLQSLLSFLH